jgi:AcrR family transcriptional regulator
MILAAAFHVFTTYGYRRTSMADIAEAAGMSRPALYQLFRSKEDIFRAYVEAMKSDMVGRIEQAFEGSGSFGDKLAAALDGAFLAPHRLIGATVHGAELVGMKAEIAGDLFEQWVQDAEAALAQAMLREQADGRIDLSAAPLDAQALARLAVTAMEGVKMRMGSIAEGEAALADLVRLVVAATHAPSPDTSSH